ncbi:Mannan endo-1-6-alpha-mannosidase DCW1 [Apiospora aurea]|uniref:Mannan endo-1,6-alpha-mannosidase n=1 Tax=Apiospora aurea TaxID=335848 RepID=A0ABR1Q5I0_9PEZI
MMRPLNSVLGRVLLSVPAVWAALDLDINNEDSIRKAAALVAEDLVSYYEGDKPNEIPGDYYWWSGALLWNTLIDYGNVTGDAKYVDTVVKGLGWQLGEHKDFMPANWTAQMSNGDQALWAGAALTAAMSGLPGPSSSSGVSDWLAPARKVGIDEFPLRLINNGTCQGALRWQIFQFNNGYDYVDTTSNAAYFALAAGLAYETKNDTLAKQAASSYDLMTKIGLIDDDFSVFDGTRASGDCKDVNMLQFSVNPALLLTGAAYMLQQTNNDETWKKRVDGLLAHALKAFFPDGVAFEVACESSKKYTCNTDMKQYKGALHRGLGRTMQLAPHTKDTILPVLKTSAAAAAKTCNGGPNGRMCSSVWAAQGDSGSDEAREDGAAAQMDVLNALSSVLMASPSSGSSKPASGGGGSGDGGKGPGSSDATGGNKDAPGNMGAASAVSTSILLGGLFFTTLALF